MKKRLSIIFLLLGSLFLLTEIKAKAIILNEDAGLNNIEVTGVTKDKEGMMWIATKRGLNKYDGYHFTEIPHLKNSIINAVLYDSTRDVIWVGTTMGLFYVHCKTGDVIQCTTLGRKNAVTCLSKYDQNIIVGFQFKYIMHISADFSCKVVYYFNKGVLNAQNMSSNSSGDIYLYIGKVIEVERKSGWVSKEIKRRNKHVAFIEVAHDELYGGGVNAKVWNFKEEHLPSDWFLDSLSNVPQDPESMIESGASILIAYRNPTRVFEVKRKERTIVDITVDAANVFSGKRVYCLFRDESNIVWVGTSKGLIKLIPDKPKPKFEKLLWNEPNPVSTRQILGDANGDLYVASYAGFLRYLKREHKWVNKDKINYLGQQRPFSQRSLFWLNEQTILIGSDASFFARYNKMDQSIENMLDTSADGMCNTTGSTFAMEMDAGGMIWLGSDKGLMSYNPKTFELFCHLKDNFSVDAAPVRCIYMLPGKKQFWAGTENGIYLVDIDKGVLLHLNEETTPALEANFINALTGGPDGTIWIGTDEAGINVLSADYKSIYSISKKDGLSSNEVYNLLWEDSTRLWIGTYKGLNYYDTQTQTIIQYFESDGITNNEFNQNSTFKASDGKMYFGGINGITTFYPPQINIQEQQFRIFVSDITKWEKSSGKIVAVKSDEKQRIQVNPGDNLLSFSFAVTDYTNPELHTYFYKIVGQDVEWIPLGSQPRLRLESLKGGEHQLLIKAVKGSRGVSSENTLVYYLSIEQEFYQTVWFYILLAMGLAGLIYYYFSSRLHTQEKLEILRVKIASNLHDEVGSLLTRITMSADRLVTRMPRDSETRDKLEGVSVLSREANVAMSDVLWTIDARNDFAGSLTDRMREHAEDLLLPKGIDVTIDFFDIDQSKKLSPEFRQHLFLLYKEIINNIIKHSRAEKVLIVYRQSKKNFLLHVKNDGVKENKGSVSTGQGLRNIKMRAELIHGRVEIIRGAEDFEVKVII